MYNTYPERSKIGLAFFQSLNNVVPRVSDEMFEESLEFLREFSPHDIIQLALDIPETQLARIALKLLPNHGYTTSSVVSGFLTDLKHNVLSEDKISAMLFILSSLDRKTVEKNENAISHYSGSHLENDNGFLCDKVNLIKTTSNSKELFMKAAEFMIKEIPLEYANICMKSEKFNTITKFVDTPSARKRLDAICYALLAGIPILIQVWMCTYK
jgi:hypothetical protein